MATIPLGQKFHTVPSNVQTVERGSALANSQREIYTMQDIIDTAGGGGTAWGDITGTLSSQTDLNTALSGKQATLVSGTNIKTINSTSILGSGNISTASVNPTLNNIPYNNGGVFADSGITVEIGGGGLKNYQIATPLNASGLSLSLYPSFGFYSFGDATLGAATTGAVFSNIGSMVMGCGISDPTFGVFNAEGASGLIRMGNQASRSIGVDNANGSMYIGSYFSLFVTPTNPATPAKWITVSDESSNIYYLPLYQ